MTLSVESNKVCWVLAELYKLAEKNTIEILINQKRNEDGFTIEVDYK